MSTKYSTLGVCPACETEIPTGRLLVEYEKEGEQAIYAECPVCEEPVHPQ